MAELTEQEIARRAISIYRADKDGGIIRDLSAMRFGEAPGKRSLEALNKAGITQNQYMSFLNNWQNYEQSQGRQFSPTEQRLGGAFLTSEQSPFNYAQSLGVRVTGAGAPAPDVGRKGSQGQRQAESVAFQGPPQTADRGPYMPPNAGPIPRGFSSADYFGPNAIQGRPEFNASPVNRQGYETYLRNMQDVNQTRQALNMPPIAPQSMGEVNRAFPTMLNVTGQGMQRVLPTPQEGLNATDVGYFGDRMAGPSAPNNRGPFMPPNMGPQIPPMGPNDGPQPFMVGGGIVPKSTQAQVGQAATQSSAYTAARDAMIGQVPAPVAQNAPPMRVTSPMVAPSSMEGIGMGAGVGAVGGGTPAGSGGIEGVAGQAGRGGESRAQNIFAVQSQAPQQYATETQARRSAMAEAMRTGQPMVLTGSNLFVGNQASQAAPGAQLSANAPTFTGGQAAQAPQQMMFNPLTRQYEPSSRGMEQGLSYRAGYNVAAGNPEDNYQRQLTAMQRMSGMPEARTPAEAARAMSLSTRTSEKEREGQATGSDMNASFERYERGQRERIAAGGVATKQEQQEYDAIISNAKKMKSDISNLGDIFLTKWAEDNNVKPGSSQAKSKEYQIQSQLNNPQFSKWLENMSYTRSQTPNSTYIKNFDAGLNSVAPEFQFDYFMKKFEEYQAGNASGIAVPL